MITYTTHRASAIIYSLVVEKQGAWIIPDNVCHAVMATIIAAGGQPLLTDVNGTTLELDENIVLDKIKTNPNIKGVIIVRTYGNISKNYQAFIKEIREVNDEVTVIDDRCLAVPELEIKERDADVYLYSTGYSKVIDFGYGGYAFSRNSIANQSRIHSEEKEQCFDEFFKQAVYSHSCITENNLKNISCSDWLNTGTIDSNTYFDKIATTLTETLDKKKKINAFYKSIRPEFLLGENFNDWRFNIRVSNREDVMNKLLEQKLFASKHYYSLSKLIGQQENKVWCTISPTVINLFNDFRYTTDMAEQTVEIINRYAEPVG